MRKKYTTEDERKAAHKEAMKKWYQANKEKIAEYYQANKEKKSEYYKANKEKVLEYQAEYYKANKEKMAEYNAEYRKANKEKIAEYYQANKEKKSEYYKANKEKALEYQAEYYKANKEKIAARMVEYNATPIRRASYLLSNYRQSDRQYNRGECTLTPQWIVDNIFSKPCHYCRESDWKKIGCDRIDNSKPHTEDNVVPCCAECNLKRQKMEYNKFADKMKKSSL